MTITAATLTSTPTRHRFTVAEYYALADAGILSENDRVELLDGDIIHMPPIGDWHAASVDQFNHLMLPPLQGRAIVRVQGPTHLNDISEPQPDVLLLRWRDDFYREGHPGPTHILLLIEISDTSLHYDRNKKLSAYARAGIPEVWIVSREDRRIESYSEPSEGTYSKVKHAAQPRPSHPRHSPMLRWKWADSSPNPSPKPPATS